MQKSKKKLNRQHLKYKKKLTNSTDVECLKSAEKREQD